MEICEVCNLKEGMKGTIDGKYIRDKYGILWCMTCMSNHAMWGWKQV
jgi:hypothetical protein